MKAQRRRYNHLATTWTHSPRWNYFIPEVGMMKKKASRMISPLREGIFPVEICLQESSFSLDVFRPAEAAESFYGRSLGIRFSRG